MKQFNKIKIIISFIIITFFGGINTVGAANQVKCTYKLPFSGINASTGRYMSSNTDFECFNGTDQEKKDCYMEATITSDRTTEECQHQDGYNDIYITSFNNFNFWSEKTSQNRIMVFGANDTAINSTGYAESDYDRATNSVNLYIKSDTDVCPKYFILPTVADSTLGGAYVSSMIERAKDKLQNHSIARWKNCSASPNYYYSSGNKEGYSAYAYPYKVSDDDNAFKTYLSNFYNISTTNVGSDAFSVNNTDDLYSPEHVMLPLYGGDNIDESKNKSAVKAATDSYRDVVGKAWTDLLNKHKTNLKNSCGDKWESYINLDNYKNDFSGSGSKSQKLIDYATGTYNSSTLMKNDNGMSEACWNTRSSFMEMFKTFRVFMYNIGVTTSGSTSNNDNIYFQAFYDDMTNDYSSNKVYDWITMNYFFQAVRYGTTETLDTYTTDNDQVQGKLEDTEEVQKSKYLKDLYYNDKCAYICFNNPENSTLDQIKGTFNTCSNYNDAYKSCRDALKTCELNYNCSSYTGTALNECQKSYESKAKSDEFNDCMDAIVPNFSTESTAAYNNAVSLFNSASTAYNTERRTYGFKFTGLGTLKWGSFQKYEPKCKDVKVFTEIWSVTKYAAPFLLIIFSSFDYFKVVIAGDEEKMKQAKKKVPLRFIAFLLLIFVPFLLKVFLQNFGSNRANNVTYIKCILTGDKGGSDN